jgi:hypothetical protein
VDLVRVAVETPYRQPVQSLGSRELAEPEDAEGDGRPNRAGEDQGHTQGVGRQRHYVLGEELEVVRGVQGRRRPEGDLPSGLGELLEGARDDAADETHGP